MKEIKEPCRKIIHIDMDAFYASVEQRDHPQYRGKPVAVGSPSKRGVIAAASYEAREYGVRSAMPSVLAIRKCPDLIFLKPRFHIYKQISVQIHRIFSEYTDLIEPLSLDEAFLDVTINKKNLKSATHIAQEIRDKIMDQTNLTASAGISINKFLAKIASDINKPNGMYLIKPEEVDTFLCELPIHKFFGVGKVTAQKMNNLGIYIGADLRRISLEELIRHFGKTGIYYYNVVRGQDNRPVEPSRIRKSIGAEATFYNDIVNDDILLNHIESISEDVWSRMLRANVFGKTLTLKVKYHDFTVNTHSTTQSNYIDTQEELFTLAKRLLEIRRFPDKPIRLLGLSVSNLNNSSVTKEFEQLCLNL
ncbi:MAG: DNA polymerase IV [Candidatus Marinimicrobia bacterium]|nr:DNA polymerase IV [Candidatus Neomarinimicrobiota bacterium]